MSLAAYTSIYNVSFFGPNRPNPQWKEDTTVIFASCFSIHLWLSRACHNTHVKNEQYVVTQVPAADCLFASWLISLLRRSNFYLSSCKSFTTNSSGQLQIVMRRVLRR